MISENLPRRTGLAANAAPGKGFEWRGIWASIVISENLPRRTGLSANAGLGTGLEWTPGGRGWDPSRELGGRRQERSACLTTGLPGYGQGCCLRVVVLQHQKVTKKGPNLKAVFARVLFLMPGDGFLKGFSRFSQVSRMFFTGVSPPRVR